MRLLVAEDERVVRIGLVRLLEEAGYDVTAVGDGVRAMEAFRTHQPDGVLLDVMMPKKDGREVCREIRALDANIPILFLTSCTTESDELKALSLGADAYLSKSLSDTLLLAHIAAALRRHAPAPTFKLGSSTIHPHSLTLTRPNHSPISLSERDVALLRYFSTHPSEVLTRDFLLTRFWSDEAPPSDNALSMVFHRLRDHLGPDAHLLTAIRGVGYSYRPTAKKR